MSIAENLQAVAGQIETAAEKAGRSAEDIELVAVSKTWPTEMIEEAVDAGQVVFGENKVQELLEKAPALPGSLQWHLIGHLQTNKIRKVIPHCAMIHSIDSLKLAQAVDRIAGEEGMRCCVLLQVNVANDDAKFGFTQTAVREDLENLLSLENLSIEGLMTVPPYEEDPEQVRPHFAKLRALRDELAQSSGHPLPRLSMGMSHDFTVAIEEGATLVRVGSSIFGKRDYGQG